jgi:hypothetical protein
MPKIIRNPLLPDRIRIIDYRVFADAPSGKAAELTDW